VKVLVLFDVAYHTAAAETFSPQELKEEEDKPTEADVLACLQRLGHDVETLAVFDDVVCIVEKLKNFAPERLAKRAARRRLKRFSYRSSVRTDPGARKWKSSRG